MRVQRIKIGQLNPAPYNPRIELKEGSSAYDSLKRSMFEFGCVQPLVWNKRTGILVGGHQRLKVLKDQGVKQVDVVVVDLSLDKEKALNIALNKIQGDWDEPKLAALLGELITLPDLDFSLTGFDLPDAQDLITRVLDGGDNAEENFDIEAELRRRGPIITKPGELLQLGNHRLLCGDATKADQVRRLMNGQRAILFATDPPYLIDYNGTNHPGFYNKKNKKLFRSRDVTWDDAKANPKLYEEFYAAAVAEAILPNAAWYCFHCSWRAAMVEEAWKKHGAFVHQQIIWVKDRPIPTRSLYLWQHEPCFFGWVRPHRPPKVAKECMSTVWSVATTAPGQRMDHPTSKPVELFAIPMRQHTKRGEICYEPFCGSGSQLIAAEKLGRRCYALEISPRYCDLIVRRWIAFVGEKRAPASLVKRYAVKMEVAA